MAHLRQCLSILMLIAASGCATTGLHCADEPARPPLNFGAVVDAAGAGTSVYRGAQPRTCGELVYLQSIGVKSILKLNARANGASDESARAATLGIRVRSLAFNARTIGTPPTCEAVREAEAFLADPQNWPIFVHCTAGKDRTGYIIGLYERAALGRTTDSVVAELHQYGHRGWRSIVMHQVDEELAKAEPGCAPRQLPE